MLTAKQRWDQLHGARRALITKCIRFAAYTLRKVFPEDNYNQMTSELTHDYQSLGAQAVNHLTNKAVLALFAPSRSFLKLDIPDADKAEFNTVGIDDAKLSEIFSGAERRVVKRLDRMGVRPKMYEALKNLIITGNGLLILEEDTLRFMGLRRYCVKRSITGKVIEILIAEKVKVDELEEDVRAMLPEKAKREDQESKYECTVYKWVKFRSGEYHLETWVDDTPINTSKYTGKFTEETLPYRVLTWDLADEDDYGTGLVEDFEGDFAALSMVCKAQIEGAILSSEFKWLANPSGMTSVTDLENAENGAVIPGVEGDLHLVQAGKSADLQVMASVIQEYTRRIAQGFLLGSAVTRDAERVTAEEIRMQAMELETSLGGVYSRLAIDFQLPMAYWLLRKEKIDLGGASIEPTIITGLDALSRNGDLDSIKLFLQDLAGIATLPPALQQLLKMDAIASAVAAGRGIQSSQFIKSPDQVKAEMQEMQQAQNAQALDQSAGQAAVDTAASAAQAQTQQG